MLITIVVGVAVSVAAGWFEPQRVRANNEKPLRVAGLIFVAVAVASRLMGDDLMTNVISGLGAAIIVTAAPVAASARLHLSQRANRI